MPYLPNNFGLLERGGERLRDQPRRRPPRPLRAHHLLRQGDAQGPAAILRASQAMELYDEELDGEPYVQGIATLPPSSPRRSTWRRAMAELQAEAAPTWRRGKFLVTLGGEHSLTQAPVKAAREVHGEIGVVQFDAHSRPPRGVRGHALQPRERHEAGRRRGHPDPRGRHPLALGPRGRADPGEEPAGDLGAPARPRRGAVPGDAEGASGENLPHLRHRLLRSRRSSPRPARPSRAAASGIRPSRCSATSSRRRRSWRWT